MTATKISLQDVVGTICDALADLEPADQTRALEAVRLTLGLGEATPHAPQASWGTPIRRQEALAPLSLAAPSEEALAAPSEEALVETAAAPLYEPSLLQEKPVKRHPTVLVQMMGDRPMVVGQQLGSARMPATVSPQRPTPGQSPHRGGYVFRRR
jgi:hypothetical protein